MTTEKPEALLPCPWCAAGETRIKENGKVWTGQGYGEPSSVSVQHWCEKVEGQPSRMIERVGRNRESAITAWNLRAPEASGDADALRLADERPSSYGHDLYCWSLVAESALRRLAAENAALRAARAPALPEKDEPEPVDWWEVPLAPCRCGAKALLHSYFRPDSAAVHQIRCHQCGNRSEENFDTRIEETVRGWNAMPAPSAQPKESNDGPL